MIPNDGITSARSQDGEAPDEFSLAGGITCSLHANPSAADRGSGLRIAGDVCVKCPIPVYSELVEVRRPRGLLNSW